MGGQNDVLYLYRSNNRLYFNEKDTVEYCNHCENSFAIICEIPQTVRVYTDRITEGDDDVF